MKNIQLFYIIALSFVLLSGCNDESLSVYSTDKTAQQIVGENITGTWGNPKDVKTPEGVRGDIISTNMRMLIRVSNSGEGAGVFFAQKVPMLFKQTPTTWDWADASTNENIIVNGDDNAIRNIKLNLMEDDRKLKISFNAKWKDTGSNSGEGSFEFVLERL